MSETTMPPGPKCPKGRERPKPPTRLGRSFVCCTKLGNGGVAKKGHRNASQNRRLESIRKSTCNFDVRVDDKIAAKSRRIV